MQWNRERLGWIGDDHLAICVTHPTKKQNRSLSRKREREKSIHKLTMLLLRFSGGIANQTLCWKYKYNVTYLMVIINWELMPTKTPKYEFCQNYGIYG